MNEPVLEARVQLLGAADTGWGRAHIGLDATGFTMRRRGFTFVRWDELHIPFAELRRVIAGDVHPEPFGRHPGGLLVLREPGARYREPLVLMTGSSTPEWLAAFRRLAPSRTRVEEVLLATKAAGSAHVFDLDEAAPRVTIQQNQTGTLFLTDHGITYASWPAYSQCTTLPWDDVEALVVPEASIQMPNEAVFDAIDEAAGAPVGYLLRKGMKHLVPGYSWVDRGFAVLKLVNRLEELLTRAGTVLVKARPGRRAELSVLGDGPELLVLMTPQLERVLEIARQCLAGR